MSDKELQIESGNYTRIANKIIEELVKAPLLASELAICFFVIRKTYGFNKTRDAISLTQFEKGINRSRPTVVKALKNLRIRNVLLLVKVGKPLGQQNVWKFNKYYNTWEVVNTPKLVKYRDTTSKLTFTKLVNSPLPKLVKTPKHTKDKIQYKNNTKDIATVSVAEKGIPEVIKAFSQFNSACSKYYNNTTQRAACERLIKSHGLDRILKVIAILPKTNTMQYVPTITTPFQLEEKWTSLESTMLKKKSEHQEKLSKYKIAFS